MDQLGDQQRRSSMCNGDSKSNQETSCNEHGDVDTNGLKHNSDDHNDASGHNTNTSAGDICNIGSNG